MTEPVDPAATAEALREAEKADRDEQVAEQLDQADRLAEVLAPEDDERPA